MYSVSVGFVRNHLSGLLGGLVLVVPLLRAAKSIVGWGGDIDFVLSRSSDPGWVGALLNFLIDPPGYLVLPCIMLGFGLIWWDLSRRSHAENGGEVLPQAPLSLPEHQSPKTKAPDIPAASVGTDDGDVPPSQETKVNAQPTADAILPGWEKLYAIGERDVLQLRFMPDNDKPIRGAVLLLCLGYKVILGIDRPKTRAVHWEVDRALIRSRTGLHSAIAAANAIQQNDHGYELVKDGYLSRVGLAEGGRYHMPDFTEREAIKLARDLIARA